MKREQFESAAVAEFMRESDLGDSRATDMGTAELLVHWFGDRLRYCHAWGSWLVWDDRRWARDDSGAVYRIATETVRRLYDEAARISDSERRQKVAAWAIRYERRDRVEAVLALARHHEQVIVRPGELDADPWALTVENGILDLRAGTLRPHDPAELCTRLAPICFEADAGAPTFERFLRRIFSNNPGLMAFVRRAAGYSLTGQTSEQCLFICHGVGANGKSTLLSVFQDLLGDYAATTPAETLLAKRDGDGIPNDLARLAGVRFVAASETEDGRRLAEARIKAMTGGDRIAARFMRAEWFEFSPCFKVWLATSHRPEIKGADLAIWRRIQLIPFSVSIPPDEQDGRLVEKLRGELPGVLAWAVRGCLEWQKRGLAPPDEIQAATNDYRADSDQLGRFLDERCVRGEGFERRASTLYSEYKAWCNEGGEMAITGTAFGRRLVERGLKKRRTPGGITYEGIGLRTGM